MLHRTLIPLACGVANLLCVCSTPALGAPRPNIVVIVTDDQSPISAPAPVDFVEPLTWSAYGAKVHTPHVDRLAREGMLFTDASTPSTVCSPSRYSMLTGRHPGRCTGRYYLAQNPPGRLAQLENNVELEPDRGNLPRALQAAGYRTGFVGKSHVINHELMPSTQDWIAFGLETYDPGADPRDPSVIRKLQHNQRIWCDWVRSFGFDYAGAVYAGNLRELFLDALNRHNVEWTVRAAHEFIDSAKEGPFFLYFATTIPHGPNPWIERDGRLVFSLDADPEITPNGPEPRATDDMPSRAEILEAVARAELPRSSAWITWIDAGIGSILRRLERHGIADNTIVVLISDHGAWRYGKSTLHEGGVRVPLIVRWPARVAAGSRFEGLVSLLDLAPTFLEVAGATQEGGMDGHSILPALFGDSRFSGHEMLFGEVGYFRSIRTKRWKYVSLRYPEDVRQRMMRGEKFAEWQGPMRDVPYSTYNSHLGKWASSSNPNYFDLDQLYDLENDPYETRNLAWKQPGVMFALQEKLGEFLRTFENRPYGEFTRPQP